ncbi:uncharacterized protein LOC111321455 [Stylophora pistillata]|uniref:uncharacterized protein LOC111321455 n=1 Tax=Stylophora pistillata TaxID=50429 RepID=UPI000C057728|nr:uncharacterized protein LOC111321455 [Stylophora pistillata]
MSPTSPKGGLSSTYVPSFLVSNGLSLAPKIDELRHVVQNANLDCICITETWLRSSIHDNVVALEGFNIMRRDRIESEHGGVCMYIKDTIDFTALAELQEPSFEMLWAKLRPFRLPRECNSIVVGTLYHPPSASDPAIMEYLIKCLSTIKSCYPNCGILIAGDFDRLQITRLRNNFQLKQIVHFPTRGRTTLDLILANISEYYQDPIERLPFGLSGHASIELQPKERAHVKQPTITIKTRDLRPNLIQARRCALSRGDNQQFRELRNRVNRERKACRAKYFQAKVEHLKKCRPSAWWDEIKKLSGCSPAFTERSYVTKSLQHLYGPSDDISLANTINKAFLTPMQCFSPLPADFVITPSNSATQQPALAVSNESIYKKLTKLNRSKAHGPDGIPGWVLKENADLLAAPIPDILNLSYREGRLPHSWKEADVVPVPKQRPMQDINKHLRPISLTPILSKIAEEYVVDTYVKLAVLL